MKSDRHKERIFKVASNEQIAAKTWKMILEGDTSDIVSPGQFVNIAVEGNFLRRPISVCDWDEHRIILLYDVVGEGTEKMAHMDRDTELNILSGLGNGFDITKDSDRPLLIGGGIGCAPMLGLAGKLKEAGKNPVVILGFNTAADVVMKDMFEEIGVELIISTADGSEGVKGFVTDAVRTLPFAADYFYACGPLPMLRALCNEMKCDGELSLDGRMACGFGICMCCSLETKSGPRRICKEGPVFPKDELIWK